MIARTPWLERRFETGLPASAFPTVLERLRGTPARVEERVQGLAPGTLTVRDGESWSIQENIGHLLMVEDLWTARLDDFEAGRDELQAARFESWRVGEARFNDRLASGVCAAFRRKREAFIRRLEQLEDAVFEVVARHPRLGQPMRVVDLMAFAAEHDDHHLACISELARGHARATAARPPARYHHLGIPTTVVQRDETYIGRPGVACTDHERNPFGIQWMRYDARSPLPELVKTVPHVAFEVDDLAAALEGHEVLVEPNSPSAGVTVAFVVCDGAPVEFLEFSKR
jgi:uncharacterized damage-inducible protein DinB